MLFGLSVQKKETDSDADYTDLTNKNVNYFHYKIQKNMNMKQEETHLG